MKNNTKSSITLPPKELALVEQLRKKLGAKSKVEVIRRGLLKLQEVTERDFIELAYRKAAKAAREVTKEELKELDSLVNEGLEDK